jgi:hypothetical protein
MVPVAQGPFAGRVLSWDGVPGPRRGSFEGRPVAVYEDEKRVDYIDTGGKLTAALTSRISLADYQSRILAMAAVYWSLGIRGQPGAPGNVNRVLREKANWAVLSFRTVAGNDADFMEANARANATLDPTRRFYRFEMYRWGRRHADPTRLRSVLVDIEEEATAYSDGKVVLFRRGAAWQLDTTIPT